MPQRSGMTHSWERTLPGGMIDNSTTSRNGAHQPALPSSVAQRNRINRNSFTYDALNREQAKVQGTHENAMPHTSKAAR
ncbi:hypothetical protein VTH06DRAFT_5758 [Thermothelomyces fergusii]